MKFLILIVLFFSCVFAQCDNNAVSQCSVEYSNQIAEVIQNLQNSGFATSTSFICSILRDFFACATAACPTLSNDPNVQLAIQSSLESCGMTLPGLFTGRICLLYGDPHIRTLGGSHVTCALQNNEVVFSDAANTITVTASSESSWVDQSVTATRSVTIANSRTGSNYTFVAGQSQFSGSSSNGVEVFPQTIRDTVTEMNVTVIEFGAPQGSSNWINVYIRTRATDTSGVCQTASCSVPRKRLSIEELERKLREKQGIIQTVVNSVVRNTIGTRMVDCATLSSGYRESCLADRVATGGSQFDLSNGDASTEQKFSVGDSSSASSLAASVIAIVFAVAAILA